MTQTVDKVFVKRIRDIDSIFSSYRALHDIYINVLKTANVNANALAAFERSKKTADERQERISHQLYSQGFILLTGAAEAILKDVFECLLIENFASIKGASVINFTASELQSALKSSEGNENELGWMSAELGAMTIKKVFESRNPSEKINFQNVQTMRETFSKYFNVSFSDGEVLDRIHRYWQMRHCLVHNNALIDNRFINNVGKVKLLKTREKPGATLTVSKEDFDQAKSDLIKLLQELSKLMREANLQCELLEHMYEVEVSADEE